MMKIDKFSEAFQVYKEYERVTGILKKLESASVWVDIGLNNVGKQHSISQDEIEHELHFVLISVRQQLLTFYRDRQAQVIKKYESL